MNPSRFVILLAHGSSDSQWLEPFTRLETRIRQNQPAVRLAYMELASPSLEQVVKEAIQQGHQHFSILPLFFAAGRHLRQDVPKQIEDIARALGVNIELLPPIGDHPLLAAAIAEVIEDVIRQHGH